MSKFKALLGNPLFLFAVILPTALIAEFVILEGTVGIALPSDRGSAVSNYEIREKRADVHFITRNERFTIVDVWENHGTIRRALVLRESFLTDRQDGIEGDNAIVRVDALDGKSVKWSFEEPGEQGLVFDRVYEVIKFGCCAAPNTYTYFSLRDGKKLRSIHTELNRSELAALETSDSD